MTQGFWGWLRSVVGNGHYWLYLLHTLVINFAVSLITWVITIVWVSVGLGSLSYGLWWRALPRDGGNWYLADWALGLFGATATGATREALEVVFTLLVGVIMVALLPFITRGLVLLHHVIARVVLGAFRSDALQREVIALSATRWEVAYAQLIGRRDDPLSRLAPRESEVLTLMAEGRTNAAIASELVIGTGAVEKNVTSIFQKLGLDESGSDHRRVLAVLAWLQR